MIRIVISLKQGTTEFFFHEVRLELVRFSTISDVLSPESHVSDPLT